MLLRKTICVAAAAALLLGLSSCGGNTAQTRQIKTQNTVEDVLQSGMEAFDGKGNTAPQGSEGGTSAETPPDQSEPAAPDQSQSQGDAGFVDTGYMEHVKNLDRVFDISELSGNMLFAEVFNMVAAPAEYVGETIRMKGTMYIFTDSETGKEYYSCFMRDAMGCCSQGFEFELAKGKYPEENTPITVEGVFDIYEENESTYCILRNARLL